MKERFHSNPMFQDLVDSMDAVVYGLKTEDKEALASEAAHYDSVLSASLKLMMREVTFLETISNERHQCQGYMNGFRRN